MGGADELHSPLGDSAGGGSFLLGAHFVDDDDLGHVVFDRLDHDAVLGGGGADLHAAGVADGGMGNVAVPGDFVGGVNDDDALEGVVGQDPGHLPEHGGLANAGTAEEEDVLAGEGEVFDDLDGAVDGTAHAAGDPDHLSLPVAYGRDAVEGALDAGPVVVAEIADLVGDVIEVAAADFFLVKVQVAGQEAGLGGPAQIEHHFEEFDDVVPFPKLVGNPGRQHLQQHIQLPLHRPFHRRQFRPPRAPCREIPPARQPGL